MGMATQVMGFWNRQYLQNGLKNWADFLHVDIDLIKFWLDFWIAS